MIWRCLRTKLNFKKWHFFKKKFGYCLKYTPRVVLSLCKLICQSLPTIDAGKYMQCPQTILAEQRPSEHALCWYLQTHTLHKTTQRYDKNSNCAQNHLHGQWSSSPLWQSSPSEHHYWLALGRLEIFAQVWKFGRPSPLVWRPVSLFNFNWNQKGLIP